MKQTHGKYLLLFTLGALCCISAKAQLQVSPSLISSVGGIGQVNTTTVEWTLGETFIGSGATPSNLITIGEQQANPSSQNNTGIAENAFSMLRVYPNPATNQVSMDNLPEGMKTICLMDATGRIIRQSVTSDMAYTLSTGDLSPSLYTLVIITSDNKQKSYIISIINQ